MTPPDVSIEEFQDMPVRIVHTDKGPVVPVIDIAQAIDVDRKNLTYLMSAHRELFEGVSSVYPLQTRGGIQPVTCLTRDGMMGLLMKVQPSRANSKIARVKIVAFQRWAIETLGKVMDGKQPGPLQMSASLHNSAQYDLVAVIIETNLRIASALSDHGGVKRGIACAVAIAQTEEQTGQDLSWCRNLLPPAPNETGRLIPTEIGKKLDISPRQVNLLLEGLGYQTQVGGEWRLTGAGRFWGEEYPFHVHGHSGYQIKWRPSVIEQIENQLDRTRQVNKGLLLSEVTPVPAVNQPGGA